MELLSSHRAGFCSMGTGGDDGRELHELQECDTVTVSVTGHGSQLCVQDSYRFLAAEVHPHRPGGKFSPQGLGISMRHDGKSPASALQLMHSHGGSLQVLAFEDGSEVVNTMSAF